MGTQMTIIKFVGMLYGCSNTVMNASVCSPSIGPTIMFSAIAMAATVNPSCAWNCPVCPGVAPHVTINSSDGLPVELLDFKVTAVPKTLGPLAATGQTAPTPSPRSDSSRLALIPAVR